MGERVLRVLRQCSKRAWSFARSLGSESFIRNLHKRELNAEEKIGKEDTWRHAALPKESRSIERVTPVYRWDTKHWHTADFQQHISTDQ